MLTGFEKFFLLEWVDWNTFDHSYQFSNVKLQPKLEEICKALDMPEGSVDLTIDLESCEIEISVFSEWKGEDPIWEQKFPIQLEVIKS